jgi:peptidoglycan/LPS O-acetylase OafA/YrhL
MGGLAALLLSKKSPVINWTEKLKGGKAVIFYCWPLIQLAVFFLVNEQVHHYLVLLINRYLFIAYVCLLLTEQLSNPHRISFYGRNRFLILTGRISFGLYCFHGLSITAFSQVNEHFSSALSPWLLVPLIFAFNFGLAFASYRYVESPFLRLKDRLRMI